MKTACLCIRPTCSIASSRASKMERKQSLSLVAGPVHGVTQLYSQTCASTTQIPLGRVNIRNNRFPKSRSNERCRSLLQTAVQPGCEPAVSSGTNRGRSGARDSFPVAGETSGNSDDVRPDLIRTARCTSCCTRCRGQLRKPEQVGAKVKRGVGTRRYTRCRARN